MKRLPQGFWRRQFPHTSGWLKDLRRGYESFSLLRKMRNPHEATRMACMWATQARWSCHNPPMIYRDKRLCELHLKRVKEITRNLEMVAGQPYGSA